jgi:hypothetical protein
MIDADRLYNTIIDEIDPISISISMDGGEMSGMMRTIIAAEPTVDVVPIKAISAWLAAYAAPPKYAIDEIAGTANDRIVTVDTLVKAWEYNWKYLMACGLLQEEQNGTDNP